MPYRRRSPAVVADAPGNARPRAHRLDHELRADALPMKGPITFALLLSLLFACKRDEDPVPTTGASGGSTSPVSFDLAQVPYDSLSEYGFFEGAIADQTPAAGVLPFSPINSLFSDYAHKTRFVWMPDGAGATHESDSSSLLFPNGAVLIKTFHYEHVEPDDQRRILETRLLFKRNDSWEFATYVWNAEQTEAVLDMSGHNVPISFTDDSGTPRDVIYRIPTETECLTCHRKANTGTPIGVKPQNLNSTIDYPDGPMNQLDRWISMGYLTGGLPSSINTVADWKDGTRTLEERVRGYVDINCAHCHTDGRYCDYRPMRFGWEETDDPAMLGVCVEPHQPLLSIHSHIVKPGNLEKSLLYYRVNSDLDGIRMPLLGRSVIHEEGRQLIEQWINSLTQPCN
jgi:uncharacterized repeat protein (TIGR03806 family)